VTVPPEHPCSVCGRTAPRVKRLAEGGGLCRHCYNLSRRAECSRCRRNRAPSARTSGGSPLCGHCARPKRPCAVCGRLDHVTAVVDGDDLCQRCYQRPVRACGLCGEIRRVAARSQNGNRDLCHRCYQTRDAECAVCHRTQSVHTGTWPLGPVCTGCYRYVLRTPRACSSCAHVKALIGRSNTGKQICGPCAGSAQDYVCSTCGGAGEQHFEQTCVRCSVALSAGQLLAAATGSIPEALAGLPATLAQRGRADSTMRWLLKPIPNALMHAIGAETAINHARLDVCPPGQARHHLRSLLVDAGVLPVRDEQTERLETWVNELTVTLPPHQATVIVPYAHWKVLRTVRRRTRRKRTSVGVADSARERIRSAVRLLRHLDQMDVGIGSLTQDRLDQWIDGNQSRNSDIAQFISWLNAAGMTRGLRVETPRTAKPSEVNAEDMHHALIRELISGRASATDLPTRVAGLLILLFGARIERIHRLTTDDLDRSGGRTYLALSTDPIEIPSVLAQLIEQLAATAKRCPSARTRTGVARYLFASPRRPHEPMNPTTLGRKLALVGIRPQITRNYAMLALASDLPAAVVATQLGLTAQTTRRWAQFSQRDGIEYIVARSQE
jgi:hypothetical protein